MAASILGISFVSFGLGAIGVVHRIMWFASPLYAVYSAVILADQVFQEFGYVAAHCMVLQPPFFVMLLAAPALSRKIGSMVVSVSATLISGYTSALALYLLMAYSLDPVERMYAYWMLLSGAAASIAGVLWTVRIIGCKATQSAGRPEQGEHCS